MCVAVDTPSVSILLYKWSARVKRIATLSAEKVSRMPLGSTCHNDLTLDGCLARFTTRRKHLVKVKMAEEALRFICAIFML
jgi:hypothetical protein